MGSPEHLRVLVTRSPHQTSELAGELRGVGLEPVLVPVIEIAPPSSFEVLDATLARLRSYDWIVFTSANAVEVFQRRLDLLRLKAAEVQTHVAAIGPATARALESAGLKVEVIPSRAVGEALAEALLPYARNSEGLPGRFLIIRAEEGRDLLPEALRRAGAEVLVAPAYRNVVAAESIDAIRELFESATSGVDAITFTSSSAARNLLALCEAAGVTLPDAALRVSIGPITSETLRSLGYSPHAEALTASVAALAQAVRAAIDDRQR